MEDKIPSECPYTTTETTKNDFDVLIDFHSDFDENSNKLHEFNKKKSSFVASLQKQQNIFNYLRMNLGNFLYKIECSASYYIH
jgi:hypothetical protein